METWKAYVSGGLDRNNYPKYVYTHKPEVITNGKYDISIIVTTDKKFKIKLTKMKNDVWFFNRIALAFVFIVSSGIILTFMFVHRSSSDGGGLAVLFFLFLL